MKLQGIAESWESYRKRVLDRDAPDVQISECRSAFYAGAANLYGRLKQIGDCEVSEAQGEAYLDSVGQELRNFIAEKVQVIVN